jgi:hypothetical protein
MWVCSAVADAVMSEVVEIVALLQSFLAGTWALQCNCCNQRQVETHATLLLLQLMAQVWKGVGAALC